MSRRLLRLEMGVFPEHALIRLHDPAVDPGAPGGPPPPADSLISATREQMLVSCAQRDVSVQLVIEEWDQAPPAFSDDYEDEAKALLYLTGKLSIGAGRNGGAVASLRMAGGVGYYGVRLYTRNRTELLRRYHYLLARTDPLGDEFQQARKHLDGLEQYLVQLWRDS